MAAFNLASKMAAKLSFQSFLSSLVQEGKSIPSPFARSQHRVGVRHVNSLYRDFAK